MITCLIIDDEPLAVQLLQQYVARVPFLELKGQCYNIQEGHQFLRTTPVDLIFLDINLPEMTGMQFCSLLPPEQHVVFITAYSEFAVESYEKNAVDYLIKPVLFDRFLQAVVKVQQRIEKEEKQDKDSHMLFLKAGKSILQFRYEDIYFIEGLKDYVVFHTQAGKQLAYRRMKELETALPGQFSRIHLSYIVNRRHITKIEDHHVFIKDQRLPISEKYRADFLETVSREML